MSTFINNKNGKRYCRRAGGKNYVKYTNSDQYFSSVSLLLHMDGTGSSFTDSSSSPKIISTYGSSTQSATQSKWGGKSAYFNGSDAYLSLPSSSAFNFSGDFTIETWVYPTSLIVYATILEGRSSASYQNYICGLYSVGGAYRVDFVTDGGGGARLTGSSTSVPLDQWSHIAIVRSGTTLQCYVNGTRDSASVTYGSAINAAGSTLLIGKNVDGNYAPFYLDDLRITNGHNRGYTGSTITTPTAAFPSSAGTTTTTTTPAPETDPYFSYVSSLLNMDGTGSSFVDSGPSPKSLTANGGAAQSATQSKWGGKSFFVEDSSKYISLPSTGITLSGDFVIECWVYMLGSASSYVLLEGRNNTSAYEDFVWYLHNGGYNGFVNAGGGGTRLDGTTALVPQNQWCHVAISREGSTIRAYVNGVKDATTASYGSAITASSSVLKVGSNGVNYFNGYIDDFRITNGHHRGYTGSIITLPTSAFPNMASPTTTTTSTTAAPSSFLAIPALTNNTSSGTAATNNSWGGDPHDAWSAFDNNTSTTWYSNPGGTNPPYIQYTFAGGVQSTINGYTLATWLECGYSGTAAIAWTFAGSNNGSDFTTIETRSGISWASCGSTQNFALSTSATYSTYRWTFTTVSAGWAAISTAQLLQAAPTTTTTTTAAPGGIAGFIVNVMEYGSTPTAYSGTYCEDGTWNSLPKYRRAGTDYYIYYDPMFGPTWFINDSGSLGNLSQVQVSGSSSTPPLADWFDWNNYQPFDITTTTC